MTARHQQSPTLHILISQAQRTPFVVKPLLPSSIVYDARCGYWREKGSSELPAKEMALATKKRDIETGEDLKSE